MGRHFHLSHQEDCANVTTCWDTEEELGCDRLTWVALDLSGQVALYQYMRLCGYPAEKISILTTYNGQKHLIRDVLTARCSHPIFGFPAAVATVDKYQGQQNDYILLSLVRYGAT